MLSIAALAMAAALSLGGVQVVVMSGPTGVMPKTPDISHPEVLSPTTDIYLGTQVLMSDDTRWTVLKLKTTGQGTQVSIRSMTNPMPLVLLVPASGLSTPIWWTGEVAETPPVEETPVPDPTPPTDPTGPDNPPPPGGEG